MHSCRFLVSSSTIVMAALQADLTREVALEKHEKQADLIGAARGESLRNTRQHDPQTLVCELDPSSTRDGRLAESHRGDASCCSTRNAAVGHAKPAWQSAWAARPCEVSNSRFESARQSISANLLELLQVPARSMAATRSNFRLCHDDFEINLSSSMGGRLVSRVPK